MQRIAFISTMEGFPWGGSEALWSQAALRLAQEHYAVYANVKGWPSKPKPIQELEQAGVQITYRQSGRGLLHKIRRRLHKSTIYAWLDLVKPHFVIMSDGMNLIGGAWIQECAARNIPYATISQAAIETQWPTDTQMCLHSASFEQARANFFVSQANLELTRRQYATPLQNGQVVRNPFAVRYAPRLAWPDTDPAYKMACVGRLDPGAKGQDLLFDVLRQPKWRDRDLMVTFFGEGPCRKSLETLRQMFDLTNVHFGDYVPNVETIWSAHHALVLPSRYEGLPLAVVEAMLCGRPCIVTNVSGNAELIADNVTGFVAAAPSAVSLDEAMERAWQRRTEWASIGQAAAESVRTQVSADPIADFVRDLKILFK